MKDESSIGWLEGKVVKYKLNQAYDRGDIELLISKLLTYIEVTFKDKDERDILTLLSDITEHLHEEINQRQSELNGRKTSKKKAKKTKPHSQASGRQGAGKKAGASKRSKKLAGGVLEREKKTRRKNRRAHPRVQI